MKVLSHPALPSSGGLRPRLPSSPRGLDVEFQERVVKEGEVLGMALGGVGGYLAATRLAPPLVSALGLQISGTALALGGIAAGAVAGAGLGVLAGCKQAGLTPTTEGYATYAKIAGGVVGGMAAWTAVGPALGYAPATALLAGLGGAVVLGKGAGLAVRALRAGRAHEQGDPAELTSADRRWIHDVSLQKGIPGGRGPILNPYLVGGLGLVTSIQLLHTHPALAVAGLAATGAAAYGLSRLREPDREVARKVELSLQQVRIFGEVTAQAGQNASRALDRRVAAVDRFLAGADPTTVPQRLRDGAAKTVTEFRGAAALKDRLQSCRRLEGQLEYVTDQLHVLPADPALRKELEASEAELGDKLGTYQFLGESYNLVRSRLQALAGSLPPGVPAMEPVGERWPIRWDDSIERVGKLMESLHSPADVGSAIQVDPDAVRIGNISLPRHA